MIESSMVENVVLLAKARVLDCWEGHGPKFDYFPHHIEEVRYWVDRASVNLPDLRMKVTQSAAYLHDIGLFVGTATDHAVNSEAETRRFLTEIGCQTDFVEATAHCVRAHRNRDVRPATLEAEVLAAADSAAHLIGTVYLEFAQDGRRLEALEKLERDWRDTNAFPRVNLGVDDLVEGWRKVLTAYPDIPKAR